MKTNFQISSIKVILMSLLAFILNLPDSQAKKTDWYSHCSDSNHVKRIDKVKLKEQIIRANKKVSLVLIYTNYCGGTQYALNEINNLRKWYGNEVNLALCSSTPYKDIPAMLQVLKKFQVSESPVYVIDSEKYKDKKLDDRYKGKLFRDDICRSCKRDVIGVPYTILFDENGNPPRRRLPIHRNHPRHHRVPAQKSFPHGSKRIGAAAAPPSVPLPALCAGA